MRDIWVNRWWFSLKLSCSRQWGSQFVLGQVSEEGRTLWFGKTWGEKGRARTSKHDISRNSLVFYHITQSKQPTCSSFSFRSCWSNSISASALARAWESWAASAQNSWASSSFWNWDFHLSCSLQEHLFLRLEMCHCEKLTMEKHQHLTVLEL